MALAKGCKRLVSLHVEYAKYGVIYCDCSSVGSAGIQMLLENCPRLEQIELSDVQNISVPLLKELKSRNLYVYPNNDSN